MGKKPAPLSGKGCSGANGNHDRNPSWSHCMDYAVGGAALGCLEEIQRESSQCILGMLAALAACLFAPYICEIVLAAAMEVCGENVVGACGGGAVIGGLGGFLYCMGWVKKPE